MFSGIMLELSDDLRWVRVNTTVINVIYYDVLIAVDGQFSLRFPIIWRNRDLLWTLARFSVFFIFIPRLLREISITTQRSQC